MVEHLGFYNAHWIHPTFHCQVHKTYKILHKLHPNVYTLKLPTNFVAHLTFHVSKFKLFLQDDQRPNWKQKVWPEVDAIEHRLVAEIKSIFCANQTCFLGKEYLVKYKGCYHKEVVWMKLANLNHLPKIVNKFEQGRGHKLGMKKTQKKKRDPPTSSLSVDEDINL